MCKNYQPRGLSLKQSTKFWASRNCKNLQTKKCDLINGNMNFEGEKKGLKWRKSWIPAFYTFPTMLSKAFLHRVFKNLDNVFNASSEIIHISGCAIHSGQNFSSSVNILHFKELLYVMFH